MEVEVREGSSSGQKSPQSPTTLLTNYTPNYSVTDGPALIIRAEEVLLVALVLILWVGAIALFFNRWGKIRMLEPYQPKFHQQAHRTSCPLAPLTPPNGTTTQQRMSFSKYNVNAMTDPLSVLPSPIIRRPRLNSVFVGSSMSTMATLNPPPRRSKSAVDIHHLITLDDHSPTSLSGKRKGSVIPIITRDRRPSACIERPRSRLERHQYHQHRVRRLSCLPVATAGNMGNAKSSISAVWSPIEEQQQSGHPDVCIDQPIISIEIDRVGVKDEFLHNPDDSIGGSSNSSTATRRNKKKTKFSRSLEQSTMSSKHPTKKRMACSLDVSSCEPNSSSHSSTGSDFEHRQRASPVYICIEDDIQMAAPLLPTLRSSDV